MSSGGQIVGAVVGGVVGFVGSGGNPAVAARGAFFGASIGAALDPPPGPDLEGPRISDSAEQTSSYGAPIAAINGKIATSGTIIWVENNKKKIVAKKEDSGGGKGGGGGSETTTYEAFFTGAILLADHQVDGIGKLWFGSNLVSNGLTDDIATAAASNELFPTLSLHTDSGLLKASLETNPASGTVRLYPGYDDQPVDPRMEADLGAGNCPSYRGMTVLFLYDYPLKDYSNSIAGLQVKAELIQSGANDDPTLLNRITVPDLASGGDVGSCLYLNQEEAVVRPREENSFPGEYGRIDFSQDSYVYPGGYTTSSFFPAEGWADTDVALIDRNPYSTYPSARFDAGHGRVFYKNELLYGFGYGASDYLYFPSTRVAAPAYTGGIAVDDSGVMYVVHGSAHDAVGAGITTYDSTGTLIEYKNIVFSAETYAQQDVTVRWDSEANLLCIGFGGGSNIPTNFYLVDFDSETVSAVMECAQSSVDDSQLLEQFNIEGGIITRIAYADATGDEKYILDRWKLPMVDDSGQSLASVVREKIEKSELIESTDIDVTLLTGNVSGYKTSGITSIRSTVSPLMAGYNFDQVEAGYKLKSIPRGQSSVATIDYDDLDCRPFGSAPGVAIDQQREMDSQLPRQMLLNYIDAGRNYNQNTAQSIERLSSKAINKESYELALVFTPTEAEAQAGAQMDRRWLERDSFSFVLPQTYNRLEPADVVTLDANYAEYQLRLTSVNLLADGRVECTAKLNDSAIYTQNATGGTRIEGDSTIAFAGKSVMHLLDIPLIRDEDDKAGFAASLCGKSTGWPGGTIIRSVDSGQTFQPVQGFAGGVVSGVCTDSLPSHDGFVIDRTNTLTINLYNTSMALSSITEAQMLSGQHWAAYGVAGRWELIQFANATLNADGTYVIDTFIRGAKGTEQYTDDHVDGDIFILLADADAAFVAANVSDISVERIYRGVTTGKDIDTVSDTTFTYSGVNLKPLSVVQVEGSIDGSSNWDITWKRRSRLTSSEWVTGVAIPLGETSESYEIDVMDGSDVVRTLTATSEAVEYSSADQVTDFGGNQSTITIKIYQLSATVGRGYVTEITL